ncbi:hypothetical protein COO60DRAFT_1569109 [Scenedesmus sp. NREL 46B-D3]|nr:hypothetical protein COO60DRAFT_1569109 [Scenedesmus sp. NREL 46B-D3]
MQLLWTHGPGLLLLPLLLRPLLRLLLLVLLLPCGAAAPPARLRLLRAWHEVNQYQQPPHNIINSQHTAEWPASNADHRCLRIMCTAATHSCPQRTLRATSAALPPAHTTRNISRCQATQLHACLLPAKFTANCYL